MKKKFIYMIVAICIFIVNCNNVNAANFFSNTTKKDVCGLGLSGSVPTFTHGIFNILKILVPIILIIMGMVDFAKAVSANDEKKMRESTSSFIRRLIAAVFIFFIVAIVQFVFKKVSSDEGFSSCMNCILNDKCAAATELITENAKNTERTVVESPELCVTIRKADICNANGDKCYWHKDTGYCGPKHIGLGVSGGGGSSGSSSSSNSSNGQESSSSEQEKIATYAKQFATGNPKTTHPYVYGGTKLCTTKPYTAGKCGVDCSGFVQKVYANNGYKCLPRTSQQQANTFGKPYNKNVKLEKGDLLFFYSDLGHVGIYIGNNKYVHASTGSVGVVISNIEARKPIQKYARIIGNSKCKKS